jgi:hypothetical protein
MNKSDVRAGPERGAAAQAHTLGIKHGAAASPAGKPGSQLGAGSSDHVCTDACTHEGATQGKSNSSVAPGAPMPMPDAAKASHESTARRS